MTDIPDEAWRRLVELENAEHDLDPSVGGYGLLVTANREFPTNRAFARYITTAQSESAELRKEVELQGDLLRECLRWLPLLDSHEAGSTTDLLCDRITAALRAQP